MITHLYSCVRTGMLLGVFLLLGAATAFAQRTVTGTIVDSSGEPLIGANVLIKGTTAGTITDIDGVYAINVSDGDVLVISYTGYQSQEITVATGQNVFDIVMAEGQLLEEVVVTGYGTTRREDVTGSVASLSSEKFNKGVFTAPDQLLQGRVAGVYVVNNSGQPGGETTVKVRGNNSIRSGQNPLYVIDGVPLDGRSARAGLLSSDLGTIPNSNPLNFMNPSDIASITVLKDASASAIYGARAANGVILVETKKATSITPVVDVGVSVGVSSILKKYDVLSGDEYRSALNQYGLTSGDDGGDVDAMDEILRSAVTQNYNIAIGGSGDHSRYRISAGYSDIDGIVKKSGIKKYNFGLNSSFDFLDDRVGLDVFAIMNHAIEDLAPISTNAGFTGNLIGQALQWNPTIALINENGEFTVGANNPLVGATTINPLQMQAAYDERANTTTILGSISPFVNITRNLEYRYRYGISYGRGLTRGNIRGYVNVQGVENEGLAGVSTAQLVSQMHTHTLTYRSDIGASLNLVALVGYEYQKFDYRGEVAAASGFAILDRDNTYNLQNTDPANRYLSSYADPISELQSYFGRVNLNVGDRLSFTATVRADGSSKFGENNRYGVFPSFGAAWKIVNESFMQGGLFDELKLRAGWGQAGNQEFPAGSAQVRWGLTSGGVQQENVDNPDLKWETSTTINVGVDFALFDYNFWGSLDYFTRSTKDLLFDPFVSEPGPEVRAWRNLNDGVVLNNGFELGLNAYLINSEALRFSFGVNAAILSNKLKDYTGPTIFVGELFGQGTSNTTVQVIENDQALNTFYTREFLGLDDSGNSVYTDDGNTLAYLGDPNANVILGVNLNLDISRFFIGANFNGAFGHELYNNTAMSVIPIGNLGTRNIDAALIGGSVQESTANAIAASSRYIEKGDFVKLANATVGFNFGDQGAHVKNLTVSLTGQNLFVITGYSGFDPEVNTVNLRNGVPSNGIEYIPYPSARTFLLSVNCSF